MRMRTDWGASCVGQTWLGRGIPAASVNRGIYSYETTIHWIGLRKIIQETLIFNGKIYGFL